MYKSADDMRRISVSALLFVLEAGLLIAKATATTSAVVQTEVDVRCAHLTTIGFSEVQDAPTQIMKVLVRLPRGNESAVSALKFA